MSTNEKSECCNANIFIGGIGDFNDGDSVQTHYFVCSACKKPCSLKEYKNKENKK